MERSDKIFLSWLERKEGRKEGRYDTETTQPVEITGVTQKMGRKGQDVVEDTQSTLKIYPYTGHSSDNRFISLSLESRQGPLTGTLETRQILIRTQVQKQERFLAYMDAEGSLLDINKSLLDNSGDIGWIYGGLDRNGETAISGPRLLLNPSGIPFSKGDNTNDPTIDLTSAMALAQGSPRIAIGLFGDAKKMRRGEHEYMTHLAVIGMNSYSKEDRNKAARDSSRRRYKLTDVNPSLDPDQFSQRKWNMLRRKAKKRATKLIKEILNENKPISRIRRRVQKIGYLFGGAVVTEVIHRAPDIIRNVGDLFRPRNADNDRSSQRRQPTPLST